MADIDLMLDEARNLHRAGNLGLAINAYNRLLSHMPNHPHAHYLLGMALQSLGRHEEAQSQFIRMLEIRSAHTATWLASGHSLMEMGQYADALAAYERASELEPEGEKPLAGQCRVYEKQGKYEECLSILRTYLEKNNKSLQLLGIACRILNRQAKQSESALYCLKYLDQRSIKSEDQKTVLEWLDKFFVRVNAPSQELMNLLKRQQSAIGKKLFVIGVIRSKWDQLFANAYTELRHVDPEGKLLGDAVIVDYLQAEKMYQLAEEIGWKLLESDPDNETHLHKLVESIMGLAGSEYPEKYQEAKEIAEQFLRKNPESIKANLAMASVYMGASRPELALPFHEKVIAINPDHPIRGSMLFTMNYDEDRDPEQIYEMHCKWGAWFERDKKPIMVEFPNIKSPSKRIKVGYISPDFGFHPVGFFSIDVLKGHNPDKIEVFLFSNRSEVDGDDALSREFRAHVGEAHWVWTRGISAPEVVRIVKEREIDILVEMAGHTAHNRLDVCAHRAAPVQVTWLGYPNTSGLSAIDYRFSDAITEPEGESDLRSTEKIWRLPNGFHSIRIPADAPAVVPPPCLKNGYITFGTYNNMNKLGSQSIALWADLLKHVPRSRIIIKHKTLKVLNNREALYSQFAMHGIQAWRVELRETTAGSTAHLASYGDIDIALDPLAYNGTTTTCDALMMGVPVLTLPGRTHAARVSASLVHRIGLDGWIAEDRDDFLRIGSMAAQNFPYLAELRATQRKRFEESPLNNGPLMASDLEDAYRSMWEAYCSAEQELVL